MSRQNKAAESEDQAQLKGAQERELATKVTTSVQCTLQMSSARAQVRQEAEEEHFSKCVSKGHTLSAVSAIPQRLSNNGRRSLGSPIAGALPRVNLNSMLCYNN